VSEDRLWWCHECRRPLRNDPTLKPEPMADTVTARELPDGGVRLTHDQCGGGQVSLSVLEGTT
jgi:hypothetical protein